MASTLKSSTETMRDPPLPPRPDRRFWWLRLLAAPVIYTVYFFLTYLAIEGACTLGWLAFDVGGTNGITVTVVALTLAAFTAVVASLLLGMARLRRLPAGEDPQTGAPDRFITRMGIMLDVLFAFLVLATGAPALLLAPCAWT
jgi:hypothetical protein